MSNEKIVGVYKITLKEDGRFYIGSSVDIYDRWRTHKIRNTQYIGKAIQKYGADSFDWEIIEITQIENLIEREQYYLDTLQPFVRLKKGFNICEEAMSVYGVKRSDETKEKMRKAALERDNSHFIGCRKNKEVTAQHRKKLADAKKGKTWKDDVERVRKHSERQKGRKNSAEQIEKTRQKHIGAKRSEKSKERMREWQQCYYEIIDSEDNKMILSSYELKNLCLEKGFHYTLFQPCSNNGKKYHGWSIKKVNKP